MAVLKTLTGVFEKGLEDTVFPAPKKGSCFSYHFLDNYFCSTLYNFTLHLYLLPLESSCIFGACFSNMAWGINQAMNEASDNLSYSSRSSGGSRLLPCLYNVHVHKSLAVAPSTWVERKKGRLICESQSNTYTKSISNKWHLENLYSFSADCKADQKLRTEMVRRLGKLDFRDKSFFTIKSFHLHHLKILIDGAFQIWFCQNLTLFWK